MKKTITIIVFILVVLGCNRTKNIPNDVEDGMTKQELTAWLQQPFTGKDFEFPESIKIGEYIFSCDYPDFGLYDFTNLETPKGSIMRYELYRINYYLDSYEREILRGVVLDYFSKHYTRVDYSVFVNPSNNNCVFFVDVESVYSPAINIVKRNMLEKPGSYRARKEQAVRNKADIQNSKPIIF